MKVSREQAAANRDRIIDVAGQLFREKGFAGIGVADLMKAAGLTHGGFYGHFKSKDDLAAQACARAFEKSSRAWASLAEGSRRDPFSAIVEQYLSEAHKDAPGKGCLFASLGPDAARQGEHLRQTFTGGLESLIEILGRLVPGRSAAARRKKAIAAMAQMAGALMLARMAADDNFSKEILEAAASDLTSRNRPESAGRT